MERSTIYNVHMNKQDYSRSILMQTCKWQCQRQLKLMETMCPRKQHQGLTLYPFVASAKGAPISYGCNHKFQTNKVKISLLFFFSLKGYPKTSASSSQLHQELPTHNFHSAGFVSQNKRLVCRRAFIISPLTEKEHEYTSKFKQTAKGTRKPVRRIMWKFLARETD
jgi:hypothetical protein